MSRDSSPTLQFATDATAEFDAMGKARFRAPKRIRVGPLLLAAAELARLFGTRNPFLNTGPRYNAAPTDKLPVVLLDRKTKERRLEPLRWGLVPFWAKDVKIGATMINAMSETIATKPAFKEAFEQRRCLVPADGFYEWKKLDANNKQPFHIGMADSSVFAFAGLWDRWKDKASGEIVLSFTIATTTPNEVCAPIHERMPVILDAGAWPRWLGEEEALADELTSMLRSFPAERMRAYPVGQRVGNVRNDDARLIEPVAAA
jgi:putative SOS response-associated peptidase YedK